MSASFLSLARCSACHSPSSVSPVYSSTSTMPSAQLSTDWSCPSCFSSSGAAYSKVPARRLLPTSPPRCFFEDDPRVLAVERAVEEEPLPLLCSLLSSSSQLSKDEAEESVESVEKLLARSARQLNDDDDGDDDSSADSSAAALLLSLPVRLSDCYCCCCCCWTMGGPRW